MGYLIKIEEWFHLLTHSAHVRQKTEQIKEDRWLLQQESEEAKRFLEELSRVAKQQESVIEEFERRFGADA